MDWDSPTTKKHIAEAEAQGCELLGPGKNSSNYNYRLACGHKQIVDVGKMRSGNFHCRTCQKDKLIAEAKTHGCELIGPGKTAGSRTYKLSCGHEQDIGTGNMRKGQFHCRECLERKLADEASEKGCQLIGPGVRKAHRVYRFLECGHEQEIACSLMRLGRFRCKTCLDDGLRADAKAQSCVLLGDGTSAYYRTYKLPCGHEQQVGTPAMRDGEFTCQTCLRQKHTAEAKARGCELLGRSETKNFLYRVYKLPCGHEQEITLQNMRLGNFRCHTCEEYFYTLPSQAYLLHIKVGAEEWLKLGYAKDIDFRTTRYGLPTEAQVNVLATRPFDTGMEAREFEGSLHRKHRRKRLRAKDMAEFHASGGTECYPVTMVEILLAHFRDSE